MIFFFWYGCNQGLTGSRDPKYIHIHIWVFPPNRRPSRNVGMGGMLRGYASGYASGYVSRYASGHASRPCLVGIQLY